MGVPRHIIKTLRNGNASIPEKDDTTIRRRKNKQSFNKEHNRGGCFFVIWMVWRGGLSRESNYKGE